MTSLPTLPHFAAGGKLFQASSDASWHYHHPDRMGIMQPRVAIATLGDRTRDFVPTLKALYQDASEPEKVVVPRCAPPTVQQKSDPATVPATSFGQQC
jgi:hypothetical protein